MPVQFAPGHLGRAIVVETFRVDHATENGTALVRFIGELDLSAADRAEKAAIAALSGLNGGGSPLVIDVSELTFCDSCGLRALLAIRTRAENAGRSVTLRRPSDALLRTLEITDLRSLFLIDGSVGVEARG
jgi:anti-sigma B factor antagonist